MPDDSPSPDRSGSTSERLIGPYRLIREIGRGGQGIVFEAEDTRITRRVALKVLQGMASISEGSLMRFRREAEAASRLDHPGICAVHEAALDGQFPYIAMRFIEGESLAAKIASAKSGAAGSPESFCVSLAQVPGAATPEAPIPADSALTPSGLTSRVAILRVVRLIEGIARSLHAAHEAGVIHRDIKPGNVMITPAGDAVIMDFGLAHLEDDQLPTLTATGDVFGTPAYMSPEQIAGQRLRLDRRTDVYSLGVTLYECLTLRRPFDAPTREALFQAVMTKVPPDPRKMNRAISKDLRVVLETALEKDRDRRYATAEALANDLRAIIEGRPIQARPVGPVGRFVLWSRREPAKAALLLVLLVALPTIATLVTSRLKDRRQVEAARLASIERAKDELLSDASYEVSEGSPKDAVALYTQALEMEGGSPEAAGGLVLAHLELGDAPEALRLLDRHQSLLGDGAAAHMLRAVALRALGNETEARAIEKTAPAPRSALEHHLLAQKDLQRGEDGDEAAFVRAVDHATTAILLSRAPRLSLYTLRAHAAGHAMDRKAAVETAAGLRQHWPEVATSHEWSGFALGSLRDRTLTDHAIASYREALRLKPDLTRAHHNLSIALCDKGLLDDALAEQREALRLGPKLAAAHETLGDILFRKGLFDDAIAAYRDAIRLKPSALAYGNLGKTFMLKGLEDDAIAAYREAIRLKPDYAHAYADFGKALMSKRLSDEAIAALREGIRLGLSDVREMSVTYSNLGICLGDKGLLDDAIAAFREAIRIDPKHHTPYSNLAVILRQNKRYGDAIVAYREAIKLKQDGAYYYEIGACAKLLGHLEDSVAAYQEAIRLSPDLAEARCNLGGVFVSLGRYRESLAEYRSGHEVGSKRNDWRYPSAQWVIEAEERVAAEERLEAQLAGYLASGTPSDDPDEITGVARVALDKGHPAAAARLYQTAFEQSPELVATESKHRRLAARAAILASTGKDEPGHPLDDAARTTWRLQGLAWLEAELAAVKTAEPKLKEREVRIALAPLMRSPDFASVLDTNALAKVPEPEQARWTKLWADIDALLSALDRRPESR